MAVMLEAAGNTYGCPWCGPMMGGGGMMGFWAMGIWMLLAFLITVAVLVLLIVAIVRLWPGRETFTSAEPRRPERPPDERDRR